MISIQITQPDIESFISQFPVLTDRAVQFAAAAGKGSMMRSTGGIGVVAKEFVSEQVNQGTYRVYNPTMSKDGKWNIVTLLDQGTGVYGPAGRPITPTTKKYLHFPIIEGNSIVGWVMTKSVKGIRAFKMIEKAIPVVNKALANNFKKYIVQTWGALQSRKTGVA